jgi:hypothetical protein
MSLNLMLHSWFVSVSRHPHTYDLLVYSAGGTSLFDFNETNNCIADQICLIPLYGSRTRVQVAEIGKSHPLYILKKCVTKVVKGEPDQDQ